MLALAFSFCPVMALLQELEEFFERGKGEMGLHGGKTLYNAFLHLPPPPLRCLLSIPPFSSAGTCGK